MGPDGRRLLTQTFYERLWVDEEGVSDISYQPPFDELQVARVQWASGNLQEALPMAQSNRAPSNAGTPLRSETGLLAALSLAGGSSKAVMVVLEDQLYTLDHGLRRVLQIWRQLPGDAPLPRRQARRVAGVEHRLGLAGVRQLVQDYQDGLSVKEVALRHKVAKESVPSGYYGSTV